MEIREAVLVQGQLNFEVVPTVSLDSYTWTVGGHHGATTTAVFAERVARSRPECETGTIAARQCRSSQCHQ